MSKSNFGQFMSTLAQKATPASAAMVEALKAKLEQEQQEKVEYALRGVWREIEREVAQLRDLRKREQAIKARIKDLEGKANDIVSGKVEP